MLVSEALGDIFGNFEGQNDAESAAHFPPIVSSEPRHQPPSPSSSSIAQPRPYTDDPRSFVEASPDLWGAS